MRCSGGEPAAVVARQHAGDHEQEIRQPVQVADRGRVDVFFPRQADQPALGAAADGSGQMEHGRRRGSTRQNERVEPRQFSLEAVDVAREMGNLLDMAEVITASALNRKESRGGHARDDYTERDDENWLKHTLVWKQNGKLVIGYKPVVMTRFEPKKRVY